jgi:UDP-3-O-[3-hydroxymyristoyl] glucosamine N-acyltransferase
LGENVVIEELVSIKDNVRIGNNCTIRSGCVIGATDFEVKRFIDCTFVVSHAGSVCIGDNVEIQSNCFVGKAVFPWDFTIIGDYTVLGSYVDVGHCGVIGKRVLIANGTVLSGSCNIGDDVWIGPKSLVNNWVHIGNNARVSLGSVVLRDVPSGQTVSGNPAVEHQLYLQNYLDVLRKGSELQFEKSTST